jgi:hypothetical protein
MNHFCFAQTKVNDKIDTSNYYKHVQSRGTTNHLRMSDAVPIIIDEMKKNGISYHDINVGELLKINDSTSLVITVAVYSKPTFGFVYETGHSAFKNVSERNYLHQVKKSFVQYQKNIAGQGGYMRVDSLPQNIFLLKQTCYWFQYDTDNSYFPVSKEVITEIIRQDIRFYLNTLNLRKP